MTTERAVKEPWMNKGDFVWFEATGQWFRVRTVGKHGEVSATPATRWERVAVRWFRRRGTWPLVRRAS